MASGTFLVCPECGFRADGESKRWAMEALAVHYGDTHNRVPWLDDHAQGRADG